ncbi:NAD(P)H:quinone oxidoreductase, partial [Bradyrhizobium sp.]|uniref:NAD(P)H:quinone oxidoreductase n=1 Tax=Bradyrhizobium sp. TaxID=376 RepID=UPI0029073643
PDGVISLDPEFVPTFIHTHASSYLLSCLKEVISMLGHRGDTIAERIRSNGKVGGAFTSTATQHGGQETTLFTIITNLLHFGMTIVGLNYGFAGQMKLDEVTGGSPYGATTITGGDGSRLPSENELAGARYQGRVIAETAKKLHG